MNDTPFIKKGRFTLLSVGADVPSAHRNRAHLPVRRADECPFGRCAPQRFRDCSPAETAGVQNYSIIVNLRLPRILMAIVVGAGADLCGQHLSGAVF